MEALLEELNITLKNVCNLLHGPMENERLRSLQNGDALPDKSTSSLAIQTIDLMDNIQRMLQPPSLTLAESFLGKKTATVQERVVIF